MENLKAVVPFLGASNLNAIVHLSIACLAISIVFFVIIRPVYLLVFHPLAKYPGPLLFRISDWPLLFQTYKGNRHLRHLRDHQKYGPIVRIGPNSLSFSSDTALNTIYGSKNVNVRKSDYYKAIDGAAGDGASSTFSEFDKSKHAVRRRLLGHAFSDSSIRSAEQFILQNVTKFCSLLGSPHENEWSEKKNMNDWANWLAYDIMGDLMFGRSFNCLEEDEFRSLPRSITEGSRFTNWFGYLPGFLYLVPFMTSNLFLWLGGEAAKENARIAEHACEQLRIKQKAEHQAKERGEPLRKDGMHYLLNSQDSKSGARPTDAELQADSLLLIAAGADTIATIISAALFYFLHNSTALRKAVLEVRSTFADLSEIKMGSKLNGCFYLQACIDETLRCASPVPSILPRHVLPGGIEIDGKFIPSGTDVGVPTYVIHHDPKFYPEPWSFKPERWILDEMTGVTQDSINQAKRAFCPFSLGSRSCPGKVLGILEIKITLAYMLFQYDIQEASDEHVGGGRPDLEEGRQRPDEYQLVDCFGVDRDGPVVQFKRVTEKN